MKKISLWSLLLTAGLFIVSCEIDPSTKTGTDDENNNSELQLSLVSGSGQSAKTESKLADSIIVIVKDKDDNGVNGIQITFSVSEGSVSTENTISDENGASRIEWTLGATEGEQTLTIKAFEEDGTTEVSGSPLLVTATARADGIVYGSVTDVNNNTYKTVEIGDQTWMAENLKAIKLNDNTPIAEVTEDSLWMNTTEPAYSWYNNNIEYKNDYGALYNFKVVKTEKICPSGWRVPSYNDWETLLVHLGNNSGGKLKEQDTTHWKFHEIVYWSNNFSGFTALPGGRRMFFYNYTDQKYDLRFYDLTEHGFWWSADTSKTNKFDSWGFVLDYYSNNSTIVTESKTSGYSIRCVKNDE